METQLLHIDTRRWLGQVRKECDPKVTIALVGNKLDLAAGHRKVDTSLLQNLRTPPSRVVPRPVVMHHALAQVATADVKAFADENGFLHYEVQGTYFALSHMRLCKHRYVSPYHPYFCSYTNA